MNRFTFIFLSLFLSLQSGAQSPVDSLLERIDSGLSRKIIIEITNAPADSFTITQQGFKPKITASNPISAAVGINTYLRQCAGVHLSWNRMTAQLPDTLPAVSAPIHRECRQPMRYYLNYCTHSYSAPFWDRKRWQQEIDWMALHGINMPLAITGSAALWRNVLQRLGYSKESIDRFIGGPAYQAWWLMNNLEGWGGPNSDHFYRRDMELQQFNLDAMRQMGMTPVLPGYCGMLPSEPGPLADARTTNPGLWCGFSRPAFLQPDQPLFDSVAAVYYDELHRLYGPARYYSMDPFHEGGNADGVNLRDAGRRIADAMLRANPEGVWVAQGWQENPRAAMVDSLPYNEMVILDLQAENHPMWRHRPSTFSLHPWLFCMLLNYGGNVGMYGKLDATIQGYEEASRLSPSLAGIGLTMEGIENNPMMYDLICDLPWLDTIPSSEQWLSEYVKSRYGGIDSPALQRAWQLLAHSVYGCPPEIVQQGTTESVFCARPDSDSPATVSAWANSKPYYDPADVIEAARLFLSEAPRFSSHPNYRYDLVDITRQAVADRGRQLSQAIGRAAKEKNRNEYQRISEEFLNLILLQDSLLATIPDFRLGKWTEESRRCALTKQEADSMEWNARTLITVWGPRQAADAGRLHDYAHREWQGLLRDLYYPRWQTWFDTRLKNWDSDELPQIDFFEMEKEWADRPLKGNAKRYSSAPEGDPIAISRAAIDRLSR